MPKLKKIQDLEALIIHQEMELKKMKVLLGELMGQSSTQAVNYATKASEVGRESEQDGQHIVEGVFDGQNMIGPDGKVYSIPANYASKSKLVEGDILKLTIDPNGTFIYKQIGPVERKRLMGILAKDQDRGEYVAMVEDSLFKLLTASVTYFKGDEGDQVVILVPKEADSRWAAVENIIKKGSANHTFHGEM